VYMDIGVVLWYSNSAGVQGYRSTRGILEKNRGTEVVQDYMAPGVLQRNRGSSVEQGWRCTRRVQVYMATGVVQRYKVAGVVQEYTGTGVGLVYRSITALPDRCHGVVQRYRSSIGAQGYRSYTGVVLRDICLTVVLV